MSNKHFMPGADALAAFWTAGAHQESSPPSTRVVAAAAAMADYTSMLSDVAQRHGNRLKQTNAERAKAASVAGREAMSRLAAAGPELGAFWLDYLRDAGQRWVMTLDALRARGDQFIAHEEAGAPPVLVYDYETVIDGATLPRPTNYSLLRILPPKGVEIDPDSRPYMIIDPRAGHGAGIGGFKPDSQVGVALAKGHPVYFVVFRPTPAPGQTIADITEAEAAFVRAVHEAHPKAPKPIVVGNCQGGWATALLAARHPELTGPVVFNGAPMAFWSGKVGENPMRYQGGLTGGLFQALYTADRGAGLFDGADLVMNFESLNPGRTWFRNYYDLYANIDKGVDRFLEFEKWWGGFYLMNEREIRWIIEQLFIGNKLAAGEARFETGRPIDLKAISAPVIVFASHGDNITPPQQALNWIADTYADEQEIQIRGKRILYMVHEQVGHLGIFVSSSVARKEHTEMASTMAMIESLPPGLYEMKIDDMEGSGANQKFAVSFHERRIGDLDVADDGRHDEVAFAAVARVSNALADVYETAVRPFVQAVSTPAGAAMRRAMHPMRISRAGLSSRNPAMTVAASLAEIAREDRAPAAPDNPFLAVEKLMADLTHQSWDFAREWTDFMVEASFYAIYASPMARWIGRSNVRPRPTIDPAALRSQPEVQAALGKIAQGGFVEGVIRMLVLLADARGNVRRDRLERSAKVMQHEEPFASLDAVTRTKIIHDQTIIVRFEPDAGRAALAAMLPTAEDRTKALDVVEHIVGSVDEMEARTRAVLSLIRQTLGAKPLPSDDDDELDALRAVAQ